MLVALASSVQDCKAFLGKQVPYKSDKCFSQMWMLLILSETIKFPDTASIAVKSLRTKEKSSVDAFEVGKRQTAVGTKELQGHVYNEKWEHINNEFASTLLRGNCLHHGFVLEKCAKVPNKEREQKNWLVCPWDRHTVPKSVRLQGRFKAQHFQNATSCMSQNGGTKVFMTVYAFPELMIFLHPLHYRDRLLAGTSELESTCKFSLSYGHVFIIYASFSVTLLVYIPMVITAKTIIGRTHLKLQRTNRRIIQRTALGPKPWHS